MSITNNIYILLAKLHQCLTAIISWEFHIDLDKREEVVGTMRTAKWFVSILDKFFEIVEIDPAEKASLMFVESEESVARCMARLLVVK